MQAEIRVVPVPGVTIVKFRVSPAAIVAAVVVTFDAVVPHDTEEAKVVDVVASVMLMVDVPTLVWHQTDPDVPEPAATLNPPIMLWKKLAWLSLVVSTGCVVVLSEPAM